MPSKAIKEVQLSPALSLHREYLDNERDAGLCSECKATLHSDMCKTHEDNKFALDMKRATLLRNQGVLGTALRPSEFKYKKEIKTDGST